MRQITFHFHFFSFTEPHTEILGGADMHVDWGSTINLTCVSKFSPVPPLDVIWYHNNKVVLRTPFWLHYLILRLFGNAKN